MGGDRQAAPSTSGQLDREEYRKLLFATIVTKATTTTITTADTAVPLEGLLDQAGGVRVPAVPRDPGERPVLGRELH